METIRMRLTVLLPEQMTGSAFAAQLFMHLRPRWKLPDWSRSIGAAAQQLGLQLRIGQSFRQRPSQTGGFGSLEAITHRADRQAATAGDFPHRQLVVMF